MKIGNCLKWKRPSMTAVLSAICFSFLATGCTFFGIRTSEEASYNVIDKHDPIEIREYDALVVVETYVNTGYDEAGNIAFRKLFAYISGENLSKTKITMTG